MWSWKRTTRRKFWQLPPGNPPLVQPGLCRAKEAQDQVLAEVAGQCEVFPVDTIRPAPDRENLNPLQAQLAAIYQERLLPSLPGYRRLSEMSSTVINTTCDSLSLITRFLAKDVEGNRVLTADLGGSNAALFYADATDFASMVRADLVSVLA